MNTRIVAAVGVGLLLLLAGCTVPTVDDEGPQPLDDGELGHVDGYEYDDSIDVDTSDGLDEGELEAVTKRAMARIEQDRRLNFEQAVPVEVISREEFQSGSATERSYDALDKQLWRAAFVIGDDSSVDEEFSALYGSSVQGYYTSAQGGQIVLVADDPDAVEVDRGTLVHELTHALQDQHFGISRDTATRDERLGWLGLLEGEGNYVMDRYEERCGTEWECIDPVEGGSGASQQSFNEGLYLSIFHPYSDGPQFVHELQEREGWEGVNAAYENHPTSTAQIIDPGRYPDDPGTDVDIADRSTDAWEPVGEDGPRSETLGEAGLFAAFWYNGVIDQQQIASASGEYARYNYTHPLTNGWDGDSIVVYEDGDEQAHVFESEWETESDAEEFASGYAELLTGNAAEPIDNRTYQVDESESFAGAYRLVQNGTTVTVVHAPTVEALDEVHAIEEPVTASVATPSAVSATGGDKTVAAASTGSSDSIATH